MGTSGWDIQYCDYNDEKFSGCLGCFPSVDSVLELPPPTAYVSHIVAEDCTAEVQLRVQIIDKIVTALRPGEKVRDLFVFCVGRVDLANALANELASALSDHLVEHPDVITMPWFLMVGAHMMSWGSTAVGYVVEGEGGKRRGEGRRREEEREKEERNVEEEKEKEEKRERGRGKKGR